jgi:hypothetical protein
VPGQGRRPLRWGPSAVLALRPLATLFLGQLATTRATKLQTLRSAMLLVSQPQEHRVQRLRNANKEALTRWRQQQMRETPMCRSGGFAHGFDTKKARNEGIDALFRHGSAVFTIDVSCLIAICNLA